MSYLSSMLFVIVWLLLFLLCIMVAGLMWAVVIVFCSALLMVPVCAWFDKVIERNQL